jgi:hypothetical protein
VVNWQHCSGGPVIPRNIPQPSQLAVVCPDAATISLVASSAAPSTLNTSFAPQTAS